jgi:hypothetical protein
MEQMKSIACHINKYIKDEKLLEGAWETKPSKKLYHVI